MRVKRVQKTTRNTAGRHFARRARRWRLVRTSTAAALVLGGVATVAAYDATATGGEAAETQLTGSASQAAPAPKGSGASRASTARPPRRASRAPAPLEDAVVEPAVKPFLAPKLLAAVPVGPGPVSKPVQMVLTSPTVTTALDQDGIPEVALEAYQHAASVLAVKDPGCHLPWQLVAAIGRVESDDGRFGGAMLLSNGDTTKPIYGIPLDGRPGVALVRGTNGSIAQAEGPMQFLPSTWAEYGVDGNVDGQADINNIFDAALAAGDFLCAGGGDLNNPAQEAAAVFRYNNADDYVHVVLALAASYENGDAATVPMTPGSAGAPSGPDTGGGSTADLPSGDGGPAPTGTPFPTPAPTQAPGQAPTPPRTTPSSPTTEVSPTVNPTATTTGGPSRYSTPAAPATPVSTHTTDAGLAPVAQPSQAPVPPPTQSSSTTTAATPMVKPTPTTTVGPSGDSTTTTPAVAPTSTVTTEAGPASSDQPGQVPASLPTPTFHPGQTVDIGWAPAMRQVVVKLLTEPAPSQPLPPTQPGPQSGPHPGPESAEAPWRPGTTLDTPAAPVS